MPPSLIARRASSPAAGVECPLRQNLRWWRRATVPKQILILILVLVAGPLAGQTRRVSERGSAPVRISGGKVRIGSRPAGSLRSFSDRSGLSRLIVDRLERDRDPRARRFGSEARVPDRSARRVTPLRGGYYYPPAYRRNARHRPTAEPSPYGPEPRYADAGFSRALPVLARAYDLRGTPSFTPIRLHGSPLVRAGFRLHPLRLPTLVVYAAYPVWRGSLFDDRTPG